MHLHLEATMLPLFVAYGLIVLFLVVERLLRSGATAKTMRSQPEDRGSTKIVGLGFGMSMLVLVIAAFLPHDAFGSYQQSFGWGGIALMVLGLLVRIWSARTLGEFYTRTLVVTAYQQLVESGPYRWLRHPGYFADILLCFGAGIASANLIVLALIAGMLLPAYIYRVHVEELMLRQRFGVAFERYAKTRRRLIPLLY
jgi:protein-S-isoprenylcysteine O-methyltransferase Ste14